MWHKKDSTLLKGHKRQAKVSTLQLFACNASVFDWDVKQFATDQSTLEMFSFTYNVQINETEVFIDGMLKYMV